MEEIEYNDDELYKRWHKSGFISLKPWLDAGRLTVDIGETTGSGLKSHTAVSIKIPPFASYLNSIANGIGTIHKANDRAGLPTPEGFIHYGGSSTPDGPISRIFKVHYWQNKDLSWDIDSFVWKTGEFKAKTSSTGAFIPDLTQPVSTNLIKVARTEMLEISYRINIAVNSYVANNPDWLLNWNKKRTKN